MPKRGQCTLCHQPKLLQRSHLIGRALYRMSREEGLDPVVMTPRIATHTQHQVKEYMFCAKCEERFNKGGENDVSKLVYNSESFPLLDKIKLSPFAGRVVSNGLERFSAEKLGVNTDKLAYYAISLVWRAAVHKWRTLEGQTTTVELDDKRREEFRQYLLGNAGLPDDVGVVVTACTDRESQGWVFLPTKEIGSHFITYAITKYAVLVRGIMFHIMLDVPGRLHIENMCCVRSDEKFIWVRSCLEETKEAFRRLNEKARVAENLKKRS